MKYLITESQINNVVFWYLDNQDFIEINRGDNTYFVNSEGDKYAQIKYEYDTSWVGMSDRLCKEISSYFSISMYDSKKIIGLWIKHKFKINDLVVVQSYIRNEVPMLMVPY